jgi:hypothetical protein
MKKEMINISIPKEDYEFLKECQNLLNTQNVRGTATPMYVIMYSREFPTKENHNEAGFVWLTDDCEDIFRDEEDLIEYLLNYHEEDFIKHVTEYYNEQEIRLPDFDNEKEAIKNVLGSGYMEDQIDDIEDTFKLEKVYFQDIKMISHESFSFFEQDAFDHITINEHNIPGKNIHTYACFNYRTPRMIKLRELLMKIDLNKKGL